MPTLSALRASPHFAPLFARVHVLCWFILVWQINRLYSWTRSEGITDALYAVSRWGFITVHYVGDKRPDAALYKPIPRTFRPLTDESWGSDLPCNIEVPAFSEALHNLLLPREAGRGGISHSEMTEGALPSLPNTS